MSYPGIYVPGGMQTHSGCPQLFPAAMFAMAMAHTIQSPFLRKHCQLPVSSQLEQWDHHHAPYPSSPFPSNFLFAEAPIQ